MSPDAILEVRGRRVSWRTARKLLTPDELAALEAPTELDVAREAGRPRLTARDESILRAAQARADARRSGVELLGTGDREGA